MRLDTLLQNASVIDSLMSHDICLSNYAIERPSEAWSILQRVLDVRLERCISTARRREEEAFSQGMGDLEGYLDFLEPHDEMTIESLSNALWKILDLPDIASTAIARKLIDEVWLVLQDAPRPLEASFKKNWCNAYRTTGMDKVEFPLLELLIDLFPNRHTVALLRQLAAPCEEAQPTLSVGGFAYVCYLILGSYPSLQQELAEMLKELRSQSDAEMARIVDIYMQECIDNANDY